MDWNWATEKHPETLKRVLTALVAMSGLASARPTLPRRHLYRAVLRLLRPTEAAARVIVATRGLVVKLPTPRSLKPRPVATEQLLRSLGTVVVTSPADIARAAAASRAEALRAARPRTMSCRSSSATESLAQLPPCGGERRPAHSGSRLLRTVSRSGPPPALAKRPDRRGASCLCFAALASALDDLKGMPGLCPPAGAGSGGSRRRADPPDLAVASRPPAGSSLRQVPLARS